LEMIFGQKPCQSLLSLWMRGASYFAQGTVRVMRGGDTGVCWTWWDIYFLFAFFSWFLLLFSFGRLVTGNLGLVTLVLARGCLRSFLSTSSLYFFLFVGDFVLLVLFFVDYLFCIISLFFYIIIFAIKKIN
jgi:hypothetical protein